MYSLYGNVSPEQHLSPLLCKSIGHSGSIQSDSPSDEDIVVPGSGQEFLEKLLVLD